MGKANTTPGRTDNRIEGTSSERRVQSVVKSDIELEI